MSEPLFVDAIRPAHRGLAATYDAALVAGFSLLIGLGAQVSFPLPFTPVPVTLQTFAVLMAGCALGSRRGVLAVLLYLEEGFAGLPVFAGGPLGVAHLFGPTGGYLLGFIAAALITGLFVETGATRNWFGRIAALALGSLAVYVPGVLWLGAFTGLGAALSLGFLPFLVGDALKVIAGWGLLTFSSVLGDRGKTSLHNDDR